MTLARPAGLAAFALAASFVGIAAYILAAEQPARLALADAPLLAQFKISLVAGYAIQGGTAVAVAVLAALAWWTCGDRRWLIGGVLMLANWPWTLVMLAPVNAALLATALDAAGPDSRALIEQWGALHTVRTGLGTAALATFAWILARPQTAPS